MAIAQYIREIGRGKEGARALSREQACDLLGQVLDGHASDLEVGGFCLAMRIKGETPQEMAGFLDAVHHRLERIGGSEQPTVVLPSYNGARRLPVLTPLLALLLAREGLSVVLHGTCTESSRVTSMQVFEALQVTAVDCVTTAKAGQVSVVPTALLCPALQRLLEVRRAVGLRNPAHSLVKLMNPCAGPAVIVGSYTRPEYAQSMGQVYEIMGSTALLLRGTEGECVADARRTPRMEGFLAGRRMLLEEGQHGTVATQTEMPAGTDVGDTARYIQQVLDGQLQVPESIARQVGHVAQLAQQLRATPNLKVANP